VLLRGTAGGVNVGLIVSLGDDGEGANVGVKVALGFGVEVEADVRFAQFTVTSILGELWFTVNLVRPVELYS
jgi:hypothetical protein